MEKTWRWFGEKDVITLDMLRQIGVEGIVTSLYHIPNGEVWNAAEIERVKSATEDAGLRWSVVESLPVSEAIKYGGDERDRLIENYKTSLENLGRAGVKTVCYNFMPVIDWIRTDLSHRNPDGTYTLYFDKAKFAYFDCYILRREGARGDYSADVLERMDELAKTITDKEKTALVDAVILKTQGFISGNIKGDEADPVGLFNSLLRKYDSTDKDALRENLKYFLERIIPTAEKWGVKMCIHPDDPPFPVLGLPRIVTCDEDIEWLLKAVDSPANGLTFCAGSLSAGAHNDVAELAAKYAPRTHFVHLRSTDVKENGDFVEAGHLEGRGDVIELVRIFSEYNDDLPMRVDHGVSMLDDINKAGYNPGYSFLGRMKALAEISGVMKTVEKLKNS